MISTLEAERIDALLTELEQSLCTGFDTFWAYSACRIGTTTTITLSFVACVHYFSIRMSLRKAEAFGKAKL